MFHRLFALVILGFCAAMTGCQTTQPSHLSNAYDAYRRGDFNNAYQIAQPISTQSDPNREASYLAGLSSYHLGNSDRAINLLSHATHSSQNDVSADAGVTLGRIYAERGRHIEAANAYLGAAPKLTGQARANAYYYAAKSQQVIGQWTSARTNFGYAKRFSNHGGFHALINNEFQINGWTLQIGAYSSDTNARNAAQHIASRANQLRMGSPRLVPATDKSGRRLVLVQIGQFTSQASADQAKRQLNPKAAVVPMAMAR